MLALRQVIPPLTAYTAGGAEVHAWDYKQKKNLVVAFLHGHCRQCDLYLKKLEASAADLIECEAVALAVFPSEPHRNGAGSSPVVRAWEKTGEAAWKYFGRGSTRAGQQLVGVFVADRYGELHAQWQVRDAEALPDPRGIFSWLRQIELACEECGVCEWPGEG